MKATDEDMQAVLDRLSRPSYEEMAQLVSDTTDKYIMTTDSFNLRGLTNAIDKTLHDNHWTYQEFMQNKTVTLPNGLEIHDMSKTAKS